MNQRCVDELIRFKFMKKCHKLSISLKGRCGGDLIPRILVSTYPGSGSKIGESFHARNSGNSGIPRVSICVRISICVLCAYSRHTVLTFLKIISAVNFLGVPGQKIVWLRRKPAPKPFPQSQIQWDLVHFARVPRQQPLTEIDLL